MRASSTWLSKKGGNRAYTCNKCTTTPKNTRSTGYTTLRRHLTSCIGGDYNEKYTAAQKSEENSLGFKVTTYVSERELAIFKWLKWLVVRDIPFSEVDNDLTRELAGMKNSSHVSSRSIKTYAYQLVPLVEAVIAAELPPKFAIMFDGWKHGTTHYVAVVAVYMSGDKCMEVLLGFSPPLDEKTYTAEAHRDLLISICEVYGRSLGAVVVLIGDNCATNQATASLLGVPLLGCYCHQLNLAIKKLVKDQPGAEAAMTLSALWPLKQTI